MRLGGEEADTYNVIWSLTNLNRDILEEDQSARLATSAKRVKWPDVEARAKRIFGNRILPNLALLEREEEAF
jgi:hypothetical protein